MVAGAILKNHSPQPKLIGKILNKNKKVLIVCQVYPIPENHGNPMRTMNFVRAFREIYGDQIKIDLVFKYGKQTQEKAPLFDSECQIKAVDRERKVSHIISRLIIGLPVEVSIYDGGTKEFFQSLVLKKNYDFILFRYLNATQLCNFLPKQLKSRTIVDYDDVAGSSLYDRHGDRRFSVVKTTIARVNRFWLKRYERRCLNLGAALFCSESDRQHVKGKKTYLNTFVVPNTLTIDSPDIRFRTNGFYNGNILLFVGTLNYKPNVQGLIWFVDSIFNNFRMLTPDAKLLVVGRKPIDSVKTLCAENTGVELHADVPDVKPFYTTCRAVIVPLLAGSGTRIKILESALMQRPVLSTPVGAEGLGLTDGREILLFDKAKTFMKKYRELNDAYRYSGIVSHSKSFVEENFSRVNFQKKFKKVLDFIDKSKTEYKRLSFSR